MSSDYKTERERKVLELYNQGKTTRDIANEQRLSLRDISHILKKHGVNHGIATIDDDYSGRWLDCQRPHIVSKKMTNHTYIAVTLTSSSSITHQTNNKKFKMKDNFLTLITASIYDAYYTV